MKRRAAMAAVAAISVVVGVVGTNPMMAIATDGEMVVTSDTKLTEDHNGNIVIGADGITLDCDGHTVQGPGSLSGVTGVDVSGRTGVAVKNCAIESFNEGFLVIGSSGTTLTDNEITDVRQGFTVRTSPMSRIQGNFVAGAFDFFAIGVADQSHDTILTDNEITASAIGILVNNSNDLVVSGNWVHDNGGSGIEFRPTTGSTISGNTADDNGRGIVLAGGSASNIVSDNGASGNHHGFNVQEASSSNLLVDNYASRSMFNGFYVEDTSSGNTLEGNQSHDNNGWGFLDATSGAMTAGTANGYTSNICVGNASRGGNPAGLCDEGGTFSDDDGNTFELDIEWMNKEGITKGCNPPTNDQFCPNDSVTRGQMAAFLVRALGYTDNGGGDLFIDDDGNTFEADIDKLATARVTKGCNPPLNDQYCPNDFVTRGQMAAFLVRALEYTDNGGGDLFIDDDGNTFEADIDKLGTAGVTKGCNPPTNDEFCPNDFVTRGQMAAFLRRALGGDRP